jgi:hypothetical protein
MVGIEDRLNVLEATVAEGRNLRHRRFVCARILAARRRELCLPAVNALSFTASLIDPAPVRT